MPFPQPTAVYPKNCHKQNKRGNSLRKRALKTAIFNHGMTCPFRACQFSKFDAWEWSAGPCILPCSRVKAVIWWLSDGGGSDSYRRGAPAELEIMRWIFECFSDISRLFMHLLKALIRQSCRYPGVFCVSTRQLCQYRRSWLPFQLKVRTWAGILSTEIQLRSKLFSQRCYIDWSIEVIGLTWQKILESGKPRSIIIATKCFFSLSNSFWKPNRARRIPSKAQLSLPVALPRQSRFSSPSSSSLAAHNQSSQLVPLP